MSANTRTVKLGDEQFTLVEQRHTFLKRALGAFFQSLAGQEVTLSGGFGAIVNQKSYEILEIFIPDIASQMPRWKFEGYGSPEAYENDEYVKSADRAPTEAEIHRAVKAGIDVNALNDLKHLGNVFSPELIRAVTAQYLPSILASIPTPSLATRRTSSSSPRRSSEPALTNGGQSPPTPTQPASSAGPSRGSSTP